VRELRETLETLDPEVRVVALMSQCFSGGFAKLASLGGADEPTGRFCGFFSTTAQQKAYGCYPETQDNAKVGHSFAFLQALPAAAGDVSAAHELALDFDDTPDVPVRTSDLYLEEVLTEAARERKQRLAAFVDELLAANPTGLNLQAQRLDRLGERFGLPGMRSRAELAKVAATLQEALAQLGPLAVALGKSLAQTNREQLRRFFELRPDLKAALDPAAVKAMDVERRVRFSKGFLYDLATFSGRQVPTVKVDRDVITRMLFRMQVRLAAVARIQNVLDGIAGERYLTDRPTQRAGLQTLLDCEALDLQLPSAEWAPPGPALPPFGQDLLQLKHIVARDGLDKLMQQQAVSAGQEAPELRLVPYRGELPRAQKPLLLFFWATWCKACKYVVPPLLTWAQQRDLTVLAITDEDAATLDQFFVVRQPFPPLIARDPDQRAMAHFGVRALPSFALLDSQRRLVSPVTSSLRELPSETVE
jgi:thiol-disulfide isomerase/thioredoxin